MRLPGPKSLLWQLVIPLIAMQLIVAVFLAFYSYQRIQDFQHQQALNDLQRVAPQLTWRIRQAIVESNDDTHTETALLSEALTAETRFRVTIVDPQDGAVWIDTEHDAPHTMDAHHKRPEVIEAIQSGRGSSIRKSMTLGKEMMYYAYLVRDETNQPRAVIRLAGSVGDIQSEYQSLLQVIGITGGLFLALTFFVTYLLSRRISRTIQSMAVSARQFAEGDLATWIEKPDVRELRVLANALNEMAVRINQQLAQLQLQRNEQRAILRSMMHGTIALDLDQQLISINRTAEQLLGITVTQTRGRLLQELVHEPELNRYVAQAVQNTHELTEEFQLKGADGKTILAVSAPLLGLEDEPLGLLIVLNDVTQLRKLESIRSDFAANVSHELRTPITNIKGYIETLLEIGSDDPKQTEQFLNIINRNTKRLESIIEDLLALARLEQPDTPVKLEDEAVPLLGIIEAALGHFKMAAAAKNITINIDVPSSLMVQVNAQLLEQAISNLASNAVKYSHNDSAIHVKITKGDANELTIHVIDDGPGIAPTHHSRLFERFYRVDRARSRELGGTGLGLAIVKHIAQVHEGRASVQSTVGVGSEFCIHLPASRVMWTDATYDVSGSQTSLH